MVGIHRQWGKLTILVMLSWQKYHYFERILTVSDTFLFWCPSKTGCWETRWTCSDAYGNRYKHWVTRTFLCHAGETWNSKDSQVSDLVKMDLTVQFLCRPTLSSRVTAWDPTLSHESLLPCKCFHGNMNKNLSSVSHPDPDLPRPSHPPQLQTRGLGAIFAWSNKTAHALALHGLALIIHHHVVGACKIISLPLIFLTQEMAIQSGFPCCHGWHWLSSLESE